MPPSSKPPFRRRNYFIKQGYQARFAVYPLAFLVLFLGGAAGYLGHRLDQVLRLQMYLPHSHLQNPWQVVAPELVVVASWGGAAFLACLLGWVWTRFQGLRRDLDRVAAWLTALGGREGAKLFGISDPEVRGLVRELRSAAEFFAAWDREVEERRRDLDRAVEEARTRKEGPIDAEVDRIRSAQAALGAVLARVSVREDLR